MLHNLNVGSSLVNLAMPFEKLSISPFFTGLMDMEMTGSGTNMDSWEGGNKWSKRE